MECRIVDLFNEHLRHVDVLEIVNIQTLPSLEDNFIARQPEK
jgi:hypothetical protein